MALMAGNPGESSSRLSRLRDASGRRGDLVPLGFTVVALWCKQLYAGLAVQTIWPDQAVGTWAIEHAAIFASTLGGALFLTAWTTMLPRGFRIAALLVLNMLATTLIVAAAGMALAMLIAAIWPAGRAVRIQPSVALRCD